MRPDQEAEAETTMETKLALQSLIEGKIAAAKPVRVTAMAPKKEEPTYIRYTPSQQGQHNSGARQRVVRLVEAQQDPMEPPKFKHKKVNCFRRKKGYLVFDLPR